MKGADIIEEARIIHRIDVESFSDEDMYKILASFYNNLIGLIVGVSEKWHISGQCITSTFNKKEGLNDMESGFEGHYKIPTDFISPLKVEVSYDGSTYVKARAYDFTLSEAEKNNTATTDKPVVRYYNNYFIVHPTPQENIENGIKLYYADKVSEINADTEIIIADSFQDLFVLRICLVNALRNGEDTGRMESKLFMRKKDLEDFYYNMFHSDNLKMVVETEDYS